MTLKQNFIDDEFLESHNTRTLAITIS